MNTLSKVGAALLIVLLLCLSPASALASIDTHHLVTITRTDHAQPAHSNVWKVVIGLLALGMAGMVITYLTPAEIGGPTLGGTFAPTATQALQFNYLVASVAGILESDTTVTLVHNWGLSTAELAAGCPFISAILSTTGGTVQPIYTYSSAANTLTVTKNAAAGNGGTTVFQMLRPHTIMR